MKIVELLTRYYKDPLTQALREKFLTPSLFDVIQKDRSETVHSNFLKWLFDLQNTGGVEGFNIISSLIQVAYKRAKEQNIQDTFPKDLAIAAFGDPTAIQLSGQVIREHHCPGVFYTGKSNTKSKQGQEGIVDLVIEGLTIQHDGDSSKGNRPFKIVIENKVDTEEHDKQTWKYYAYFEGKTPDQPQDIEVRAQNYTAPENEDRIYLYLTPASNPSENVSCSCPHFIRITYRDIMEHCIIPLLQNTRLDARNRMFLEEYSRVLSIPYINNNGKNIIMSLNPADADLLKNFWEANQELITMSLEALRQESPDDNKEVVNTLNAISALQGKRTKYQITHLASGDTVDTNQTNLMYDLVNMYIKHGYDDCRRTLNEFQNTYADITSLFNSDPNVTGYKWNDELQIGITTQKQRNAEILNTIKRHAADDGFIIQ